MSFPTKFNRIIWFSPCLIMGLILCLILSACSSGGDGGSSGGTGGGDVIDDGGDAGGGDATDDGDPVPAEGAPTVTVDSSIKQLLFSWNAQEGDAYYLFSENPGDASGFSEPARVEGETETTLDIAVHRHNWVDAAYIVEACNATDECIPSLNIYTDEAMLGAIGYFKASNTGAGDEFGQSVALSDDGLTLAVGAHLEESNSIGINSEPNDELLGEGPGAVYIFTRGESGWVQQAYIKPPAVAAKDDFGHSVALSADGNTLAVGATWGDSALPGGDVSIGITHLFIRDSEGTWTWQASLEALNPQPGSQFGTSVDLSDDGNLLAVGAPGGESTTGIDGEPIGLSIPGSVYLFSRTGADWAQLENLVASNGEPGDEFGFDVALSGDGTTLVAGAYRESSIDAAIPTDNTAPQAGAVYVFSQGAGGWSEQAYLKGSAIAANAHFGYALAISDDGNLLAVAVGNKGQERDVGAVDIFTRAESSWSHQTRLAASNAGTADSFGSDLAVNSDGSLLAVGASWEDGPAQGIGGEQGNSATTWNTGAVYLFASVEGAWAETAYVKAANPQTDSLFGHSVALDASGDTLAAGAVNENSASTGVGGDQTDQSAADAGAVYLY